jgi:hypothetical protein
LQTEAMVELSGEAKKLLFTLTVFWVFMGVCAIFYGAYEGWTVGESFFFAVVTMSSVGEDHTLLWPFCFIVVSFYITVHFCIHRVRI